MQAVALRALETELYCRLTGGMPGTRRAEQSRQPGRADLTGRPCVRASTVALLLLRYSTGGGLGGQARPLRSPLHPSLRPLVATSPSCARRPIKLPQTQSSSNLAPYASSPLGPTPFSRPSIADQPEREHTIICCWPIICGPESSTKLRGERALTPSLSHSPQVPRTQPTHPITQHFLPSANNNSCTAPPPPHICIFIHSHLHRH